MLSKSDIKKTNSRGFTVIEILVVIVIIAILATISFIVYSGIARKAAYASMEAEANNLSKQLAMYSADEGRYPSEDEFNFSDDCDTLESEGLFCFETDYYIDYGLDEDDYWFEIWPIDEDDTSSPCYDEGCDGIIQPPGGSGTLPGRPTEKCPTGFIPVPGSARYSQPGFCVMKYEAKNVNGKAVSQAAGLPWVNISFSQALEKSQEACDDCQLIDNRQWMTLARNILSQPENWFSEDGATGEVGVGRPYEGFRTSEAGWLDLPASSDDDDGYFGLLEGGDNYPYERRTYKLSNGETIWDLSGHQREFVRAIIVGSGLAFDVSGCQFPGNFYDCSWDSVGLYPNGSRIVPSPFPASLGISGVSNESAKQQRLGVLANLYYNQNPTELSIRGGTRHDDICGLLCLDIRSDFGFKDYTTGFRATKQ